LLGALHHMSFVEKILKWQDVYSKELEQIGLWAAPAITPYPLNKLIDAVRKDSGQEARTMLIEHCNNNFIDKLTYNWWTVKEFAERKPVLVEAIDSHKRGQYRVAIHTLLPHVEGIITDWIYRNEPEKEHPFKQDSKTKEFFISIKEKLDERSLAIIIESTSKFILQGPVLESFTDWKSKIKNSFANRHVVGHGKYDDALFSEENSIKLMLLLDTLYYKLKESNKSASK